MNGTDESRLMPCSAGVTSRKEPWTIHAEEIAATGTKQRILRALLNIARLFFCRGEWLKKRTITYDKERSFLALTYG
ncbi:hypothetical protein GCM10008014_50320 [Paenibacillus silvae]|uniref:Tn3 transposase DDE domain-containing protein n=1 Tax=Paenibacillus silvae TaxID=1325358 RepID=A0ABQ1ZLF4_9BACL|nr:hypothetical protein GCM10008014_50320 [Paenibacillus silvae]